jgi:hypothetical protein
MVNAIAQWLGRAHGWRFGRDRWEEPVDRNTAWRGAYSTDYPSLQGNPSPPDRTTHEATLRLTRAMSLIVILLISLGLWASIWVVGLR